MAQWCLMPLQAQSQQTLQVQLVVQVVGHVVGSCLEMIPTQLIDGANATIQH